MKNLDTPKQLIAIGIFIILIVFLFTRDIEGLKAPKTENEPSLAAGQGSNAMAKKEIKELTISDLVSAAHDVSSEKQLKSLESQIAIFEKSTETEKITYASAIAKEFLKINQPGGSAYFEEIALGKSQANVNQWLSIGDKYVDAFNLLQDKEALQSSYLQKANNAYSKVLAIDSTNLDAKTGLGITIVNGLGMPMQGIAKLLEVVAKDPKNLKATVNLGLFAMKSGQFDKAIERFKTVITIKPDAEAYFYLGTAYENLKENAQAIEAFQKSKGLAKNPTLSDFIDKKVAQLQVKKN